MDRLWDGHGEALGRFATTDLWGRCARRFLEFAAPEPLGASLDFACAAGLLTPFLRSRSAEVHALDPLRPDGGSHASPHTHRVRASERHLPYASGSFDLACAALCIPTAQDIEALLRVVRPGGGIALVVPAPGLRPEAILDDPSVTTLDPHTRDALGEVLERAAPAGRTDVEIGRWFAGEAMIGIRTVELLEGTLLMAKARRR